MTRSKVKVTGLRNSENCTFQVYLLRHLQWESANDHRFLNYSTISKFDRSGFVIFVLVFTSRDLGLGALPAVIRPQKVFFRFQWHLVCRYRSMTDACRYTLWSDTSSRSRSRLPLKRSRSSIPHGTNFFIIFCILIRPKVGRCHVYVFSLCMSYKIMKFVRFTAVSQ